MHMKKRLVSILRNRAPLIVSAILALSLCANVVLITLIALGDSPKQVVGTYCTGDEKDPATRYIVFERDGKYVVYKQFEHIETGSYSEDGSGNGVYMLTNTDADAKRFVVFNGSDQIYFFDPVSGITTFSRISETAAYINLPSTANGN